MKNILKLQNVQKYYGNENQLTKAIDNISFSVQEGEFVVIMGASGSGKTTLLNCIATIDTVSSGHIYLEEQDVTELKEQNLAKFRRENLGFIFQDFNLLDTLTIEENIALALTINQKSKEEIEEKVHKIAKVLNIENILKQVPYQTSGGQKQRCAAARAIIHEPKLILADEPTGSLDSKNATELLEILNNLNRKHHTTILMVTHDPYSASYANRILFLKDGNLFNEIIRGEKSKQEFYQEILDVISILGGDMGNAI